MGEFLGRSSNIIIVVAVNDYWGYWENPIIFINCQFSQEVLPVALRTNIIHYNTLQRAAHNCFTKLCH